MELLDEAIQIAVTPLWPGALPGRARLRAQAAELLLVLGNEVGGAMRHRIWSFHSAGWRIADDIRCSAEQHGLPPAQADAFMAVPNGFFQRHLEGRRTIHTIPAPHDTAAPRTPVISYSVMAATVQQLIGR